MEVLMPYGKNMIKVEAPEEAKVVHGTYLPPLADGIGQSRRRYAIQ